MGAECARKNCELQPGSALPYVLPAMRRTFLRPILVLAVCTAAAHAEDAPPPTPKPGLLSRTWTSTKKLNPLPAIGKLNPMPTIGKLNPFGHKNEAQQAGKQVAAMFKGLAMTMSVEPAAPNLGEHKQIAVTLRLQNKGKKLVQLDFPTTQRIEVLVKNSIGKTVEQWSEDQAFQNEPSLVTINPGERLEYNATIATRDFAAGQEYTVEGFFPTYDMLRSSVKMVPVR